MSKLKFKNSGPIRVIFKVDKEYDFQAGKGYDGKDIIVNPRWYGETHQDMFRQTDLPVGETPVDYVRIFGEVVAIPEKIQGNFPNGRKIVIGEHHPGQPIPRLYFEDSSTGSAFRRKNYITIEDIAEEVEVGDRIYFPEETLDNQDAKLMHQDEDDSYYAVQYDRIICAVKYLGDVKPKGKVTKLMDNIVVDEKGDQFIPIIKMIGSWVLVKPKMESEDEILVPVKGEDGKEKPKDLWIQTKPEREAIYKFGYIAHIGTPLKGFEPAGQVGDEIVYSKDSDYELEIEGEKYYAMKQRDILGRIEK